MLMRNEACSFTADALMASSNETGTSFTLDVVNGLKLNSDQDTHRVQTNA